MKLNFIKQQGFTLPVTFYSLLNDELAKVTTNELEQQSESITFNFRDDDYSAQDGGFHPVEIRLEKQTEGENINHWQLIYITDFSYQGYPYPELVKEIDVCFITKQVFSLYGGWLNKRDGLDLLNLFIGNFIEYHSMNTYSVTVS